MIIVNKIILQSTTTTVVQHHYKYMKAPREGAWTTWGGGGGGGGAVACSISSIPATDCRWSLYSTILHSHTDSLHSYVILNYMSG